MTVTETPGGDPATGAFARGAPAAGGRIVANHFYHDGPPDRTGGAGAAYCVGAEGLDTTGIDVADNHYGRSDPPSGVGIPGE